MRIRFLADENIYHALVIRLRSRGYDVMTVDECGLRGVDDSRIMEYAIQEQRIIITFDRDFSDLRSLPKNLPGVLLLRLQGIPIEAACNLVIEHVMAKNTFALYNHLTVLRYRTIRRRKI